MVLKGQHEVLKDEGCYMWCLHGTSLCTAQKILFEDNLRAGPSTDDGKTGVFFVGPELRDDPIDLGTSFKLARDRAKCRLCLEWMQFGSPSVWSMPVVLMFQYKKSDATKLKRYKVGHASKWVIQCCPGTPLNDRTRFRLLLNIEEYQNWVHLHYHARQGPYNRPWELKDIEGCDIVMCGGRIDDPLYWSRMYTNCSASCGRFCRVQDLQRLDWRYAINCSGKRRIYRCPQCHF